MSTNTQTMSPTLDDLLLNDPGGIFDLDVSRSRSLLDLMIRLECLDRAAAEESEEKMVRVDPDYVAADFPVFGNSPFVGDTDGIYSYDDAQMLVKRNSGWEIVPRSDLPEPSTDTTALTSDAGYSSLEAAAEVCGKLVEDYVDGFAATEVKTLTVVADDCAGEADDFAAWVAENCPEYRIEIIREAAWHGAACRCPVPQTHREVSMKTCGYTHFDSLTTQAAALKFARGNFQRALLQGGAAWSAMTLAGNAAAYRGKYIKSGENLLSRLKKNGFGVQRVKGDHNRREYTITLQAAGVGNGHRGQSNTENNSEILCQAR